LYTVRQWDLVIVIENKSVPSQTRYGIDQLFTWVIGTFTV
jgi:hypothetical protein